MTTAPQPPVCGLRVRLGVEDRDLAVQVCNRLQSWLPVIRALCGNSPLHAGVDTGHASWRWVQLHSWPTSGPTPVFESAADYDRTVGGLVAARVLPDRATVNWAAHLSDTGPTLEIAVGDVCPTIDDTVLITALVRAAAATAITDVRSESPAPRPRDCVIDAAHWCAARDGLSGKLLDLRTGRLRAACYVVDDLFTTVGPALVDSGDVERAVVGLSWLRWHGDGATRQRHVLRRTRDIDVVIDMLAEQTVAS
jgi:carboxylate-amine ligase